MQFPVDLRVQLWGARLAMFPGIAFLLRSQKVGGTTPAETSEQPLLPLALLLCTKESVLLFPEKSVSRSGAS